MWHDVLSPHLAQMPLFSFVMHVVMFRMFMADTLVLNFILFLALVVAATLSARALRTPALTEPHDDLPMRSVRAAAAARRVTRGRNSAVIRRRVFGWCKS